MARFQCADCSREHGSPTGCRCGAALPQIQLCQSHGTHPIGGCRVCRMLARSQSGH